MKTQRIGLTLIETLVVIGIIGILLAILIPAVQYVRESARRTSCQNSMRQLTLAILNQASAHSALPDLYNGTFLEHRRYAPDEFHYHSWRNVILPQLEHSTLYDRIDFDVAPTVVANQSIANTVFQSLCARPHAIKLGAPSILAFPPQPNPPIVGMAVRSDAQVIGGVLFRPSGTTDLPNVNSVHGANPELTALFLPQLLTAYRDLEIFPMDNPNLDP